MPRRTNPIADSVWLRPPRTRSGQPALSREQIVRAALELLDAQGAAGLTMRRLGSKLGSGATSIYWYVATKDELLDLALDEVMGELAVPDVDRVGWRAAAEGVAREMRALVLRHPWVTSLFGVRLTIGPQAMALSDRFIVVLESAGFTGLEVAHASSVLLSHAIGSATTEAAWRGTRARAGLTAQEAHESLAALGEKVIEGHPNYAKWWRVNQVGDIENLHEESFTFGLARILDGLEAWLAREERDS
jgi:AcrR family transcriptional regulator